MKPKDIDLILKLAEKIDHDQFCGCSSMVEDPEPPVVDCPLGALQKAVMRAKGINPFEARDKWLKESDRLAKKMRNKGK